MRKAPKDTYSRPLSPNRLPKICANPGRRIADTGRFKSIARAIPWAASGKKVDILRAINGEDSYGVSLVLRDRFAGFLPQPPYFSGGQRRGFAFGLSAPRSCGPREFTRMQQSRQAFTLGHHGEGLKAQEGNASQRTVELQRKAVWHSRQAAVKWRRVQEFGLA